MSRGFDGPEIDDFQNPERDARHGPESNRRAGWDTVRRLERIHGKASCRAVASVRSFSVSSAGRLHAARVVPARAHKPEQSAGPSQAQRQEAKK
jgi:hypothetical protein